MKALKTAGLWLLGLACMAAAFLSALVWFLAAFHFDAAGIISGFFMCGGFMCAWFSAWDLAAMGRG